MINIIPKPFRIETLGGAVKLGKLCECAYPNAKSLFAKIFASADDGTTVSIISKESIAKGGYVLKVNDDGIIIESSSENGAIYAIQTLAQVYDGVNVPKMNIEDKPQYEWRAFMLDSARHFWSVEHIKNTLDIMSNLKLNVFHWHLTDDQGWRLEIKKYPELTEKGSIRKESQLRVTNPIFDGIEYGQGLFYTQEDVKDVIAYAQSLGISVVPEIDMPGHLIAVLSCHPEWSCEGKPVEVSSKWGVMDTIGCCGNDDFYKFVEDILDEVCDLFPFEYFHIGGDEVPKTKWKTCPKCQAKINELGLAGENELQGYFTNYVMQYVAQKGKKLIGWNEILDATTLDKNTVIQWWTPMHGKGLALNWLASGGKAILSKHQDFYMDHSYIVRPLKKQYNFTYKKLGIKDRTNVLGIEAPQWTEYISTKEKFDFCTYPRMLALAECAWTEDDARDYNEFVNRLETMREYFEKTFGIAMADKFSYEGKHLGAFMREARGWPKWHANPNHELEQAKARKSK